MKKVQIIRHLTFLLLAAMLCAVVPVHQLFHKHISITSTVEKSKTFQLKKAEKPCCKAFESVFGNTVSTKVVAAIGRPVSTIYTVSFFAQYIKPFLQLSNKAPPVSIA